MNITYKNTYLDIIKFQWVTYTKDPLLVGIIFLCAFWVSYGSTPSEFNVTLYSITFLTLSIATILVASLFTLIIGILSMISTKNKTIMAEQTLSIQDDCLISENEYGKSEYKWNAVRDLIKTRKYIFIYTAKYAAYVLPKRAFPNNESWEEFYSFCQNHIK